MSRRSEGGGATLIGTLSQIFTIFYFDAPPYMQNVRSCKQIYMVLKLISQKTQSLEEILILLSFAILDKLEKANWETISFYSIFQSTDR